MLKSPPASSERVRFTMSRIRSSDTRAEKTLRKALWANGLRFRKNYRKLPGKPDVVFLRPRIAVFCDGDFWHGRNWPQRKRRLRTNASYWIAKIERNRARDKKVNAELKRLGWTVIRIWESDIQSDIDASVARVTHALESIIRHADAATTSSPSARC